MSLPDDAATVGDIEHERASGVQDIAPVVAEFGKYHLLAVLGRGGMGDVYLAMMRGPLDFDKLVVIKKLRGGIADDEQILAMFLDEGRVAARLNHPHLVQTHEIGEVGGAHYLAMEYLEGQPVARLERGVAPKDLDPRMACRIISDALSGLQYAHELRDYDGAPLNFVHRDLSPQNIFVTYEGVVKIVDFGIAKTALGSPSRTEAGMLKGKLSYIAPEQVVGETVDRRADIFSIGVVLWELIARRRLIQGKTAAATLNNLVAKPIPRLSAVVTDVDSELDAIVARALEKDADARYQTAREMHDALERYLARSGRPIRHEDLGAFVSEKFRERRLQMERQIQDCMAAIRSGSVSRIPAASSISKLSNVSSLAAVSMKRAPSSAPSSRTLPPDTDELPTLPRFRGPFLHALSQYGWWGAAATVALFAAFYFSARDKPSTAPASATLPPGSLVQSPSPSPVLPSPVPASAAAPRGEGNVRPPKSEPESPKIANAAKKVESKPGSARSAPAREPSRQPADAPTSPSPSASRDKPAAEPAAPATATNVPAAPAAPAQLGEAPAPGRRKFRTEF